MRRLDVIDGGLFTTVQDLGRVNYQRFGVTVSGAMDSFALRAATRIAGNADNAAALEITMTGPELRFASDGVIAVTGAEMGPQLDGRPIRTWVSVAVRAGSVLSFAGLRSGMRAYVAVDGGIDVPIVLGSRSTSTRAALGGFEGRSLRAGDVLPIGDPRTHRAEALCHVPSPQPPPRRGLPRHAIPVYTHDYLVRVVLGPQDDAFTEAALQTLETAVYTMSAQSDRIGCRFQGPVLSHRVSADIVSDGTTMGSIQVSGDGMPIVLMADRGTTGGYTKIATVITADLASLAQAVPGDRVRFRVVSLDDAHRLLRAWQDVLHAIGASAAGARADVPDDVFDEDSGAPLAAAAWTDLADAIDLTSRKERHDDTR